MLGCCYLDAGPAAVGSDAIGSDAAASHSTGSHAVGPVRALQRAASNSTGSCNIPDSIRNFGPWGGACKEWAAWAHPKGFRYVEQRRQSCCAALHTCKNWRVCLSGCCELPYRQDKGTVLGKHAQHPPHLCLLPLLPDQAMGTTQMSGRACMLSVATQGGQGGKGNHSVRSDLAQQLSQSQARLGDEARGQGVGEHASYVARGVQ